MGLLVGPIELLLLQNEVFTDHDGTAARKVSEKKNQSGIELEPVSRDKRLSQSFL